MRPRFIADADLSYPIVAGLRRRERAMDILSADEGGLVGLPDVAVLGIAAESGRILISHDRNTMIAEFWRFIATKHHPGLIIVKQQPGRIGATINQLLRLWNDLEADEFRNTVRFVRINRRG